MKKVLSLILVLSMLSSMSVCAFAAEEEATTTPDAVVSEGETLADAIDAAVETDDATVTVDASATNTDVGGAVIDESVTIDLEGNDITIEEPSVGSPGTVTIGLQVLEKSEEVVIEGDGATITFDGDSDGEGDGNHMLKRGVQNYSDLTLNNVTIDGTDLANYEKVDGVQTYNPDYENIVISNCNGSLTVENGAGILADEGDVAIDVYAYTSGGYTDGPEVTIAEDAGTIQGTIVFDGDEGCEDKVETEPSLTIEGGIFNNFLLKIGQAVANFIDNISISGGSFDTKNVQDDTGNNYQFENFLKNGYVVVELDGRYEVMTQEAADALKAPVVDEIPSGADVVIPAPVPAPAPAPAPETKAEVVVAEPVTVEVNGAAVELVIAEEEIEVEVVAPAAAGEAAELKVVIPAAALAVEGVETSAVIEAVVAAVVVEVKDGETVAADSYEITFNENGELSIELSAEYLEALGPGEHIIIVKIGGIEVEFTIVIE